VFPEADALCLCSSLHGGLEFFEGVWLNLRHDEFPRVAPKIPALVDR
jgi:hypothetical protein